MENVKQCPCCGETINAAAKKCKHCGEWLDGNSSQPSEASVGTTAEALLRQVSAKRPGTKTLRVMSIIGICFFSLLILGLCSSELSDDMNEDVANGVNALLRLAGQDSLDDIIDGYIGIGILSSLYGLALSIVTLLHCNKAKE